MPTTISYPAFRCLRTFTPPYADKIVLSPDGQRLIGCFHKSPVVKIWDVKTGELLRSLRSDETTKNVSVASDGETAFSLLDANTVKVWNVETGEELCRFSAENMRDSLFGI